MKNKFCFWTCLWATVAFGFTVEQDQAYNGPSLESYRLETICSDQGVIKFRLLTDKAMHYENGDRIYPEGLYIEFYQPDEGVTATGRANSVYFFAEKNVYEFRGDVELKSLREKRQLNTEELHWNPDTAMLHTDKFIRIETKDQMLTGNGLTAKQDLSYYHIAKPQGVLRVDSIEQRQQGK